MTERQSGGQQPNFQAKPGQEMSARQLAGLNEIQSVRDLGELREMLGPLLPEEKDHLASVDRSSEPTPEELQRLGSNFTEHLVARTREAIESGELDKPTINVNPETDTPETDLERRRRWNSEHIVRFETALRETDERYKGKKPEEREQIRQYLEETLSNLRTKGENLQNQKDL